MDEGGRLLYSQATVPESYIYSNLLTCILCMSQLTVYFYFRWSTKRKDWKRDHCTSARDKQLSTHKMECEKEAELVRISMIF